MRLRHFAPARPAAAMRAAPAASAQISDRDDEAEEDRLRMRFGEI
jgi:hypothetical protein